MDEEQYPYKAKARVLALIKTLTVMSQRDPEQEVRGIAVPVLDAAVEDVKAALGDDPIVSAIAGIISAETIAEGEPIRAIDALFVAEQLDAAIGPYPLTFA